LFSVEYPADRVFFNITQDDEALDVNAAAHDIAVGQDTGLVEYFPTDFRHGNYSAPAKKGAIQINSMQ